MLTNCMHFDYQVTGRRRIYHHLMYLIYLVYLIKAKRAIYTRHIVTNTMNLMNVSIYANRASR